MHNVDDSQAPEERRRGGQPCDDTFAQVCEFPVTDTAKAPALAQSSEDPFVEIPSQNELARTVHAWESERQKFLLRDFLGRRHVPTLRKGRNAVLLGGLLGLFWTILALALVRSEFETGWLLVAGTGFALLGFVLIVGIISRGIYECLLARQYTHTFAAYQAHCTQIRTMLQKELAAEKWTLHNGTRLLP